MDVYIIFLNATVRFPTEAQILIGIKYNNASFCFFGQFYAFTTAVEVCNKLGTSSTVKINHGFEYDAV